MTDKFEDFPPDAVMRTALTDTNGNMTIFFPDSNSYTAYVAIYCAELDPTANGTSRKYYINVPFYNPVLINPFLNQTNTYSFPNVLPFTLFPYSEGSNISLYPDPTSPLGPLVNALEFLESENLMMATLTNLQDGELIIWV
jgi:hypothetical protein